MRKKTNKKQVKFNKQRIIIITVVTIILIMIILLAILKKISRTENNPENPDYSQESNKSQQVYTCQKTIDETDTYINYSIVKLTTKDGIIQSSNVQTKLKVKNEETFNDLINNATFMENKTYDGNDLSIIISSENEDFTSDNENVISYNDYKVILENAEYTCENERF